MKLQKIVPLGLCFLLALEMQGQLTEQEGILKIGDIAPAIKVHEWIKGEPVNKLTEGHVFVIEFSATGCAPCRKAIPHLTRLSRQYQGQATFISIYSWSRLSDTKDIRPLQRVHRLVETLGDGMDFKVAADTPSQESQKEWLLQKNGFYMGTPTAFLVDRTGRIAWVGHDVTELDRLLPLVIKGIPLNSEEPQSPILAGIKAARQLKKDGRYKESLQIIDNLIAEKPEKGSLYTEKYKILAESGIESADELLSWLLQNPLQDFNWEKLLINTWTLGKNPNYSLALKVADKAINEAESNDIAATLHNDKANIYLKLSAKTPEAEIANQQIQHGIECLKSAIDLSLADGNTDQVQKYQNILNRFNFLALAGYDDAAATKYLQLLLEKENLNTQWLLFVEDALAKQKQSDYNLLIEFTNHELSQSLVMNNYSLAARAIVKQGDLYLKMNDKAKALKAYQAGEQFLSQLPQTSSDSRAKYQKKIDELKNRASTPD